MLYDMEESREEPSKDMYSGYYWGNDPYDSHEMPGRKSDEELKKSIKEHLRKGSNINLDLINISVKNETATITGHVKTYQEKRLIGEKVWNTPGIAKVLNNLEVTEPETAGPSRVSEK
jgi:osmotically-inducible protein OsmY